MLNGFTGGAQVNAKQKDAVDFKSLRELYRTDNAARHVFDHFASRERNWRSTSVDTIQSNVNSNSAEVSRGEVISVFRQLEEAGCGTFKTGRKGWPSRFEWDVQMVSVGQAAAGETDDVQDMTDEDNGEQTDALLRHPFRLRPNLSISIELPSDFTDAEASRLADFVKTLPFT